MPKQKSAILKMRNMIFFCRNAEKVYSFVKINFKLKKNPHLGTIKKEKQELLFSFNINFVCVLLRCRPPSPLIIRCRTRL